MTTRNIVLIVAAAALAGCASTNGPVSGQSAGLNNGVYVVDNGTSARTLKTADADATKPDTVPNVAGESKPMRIFWFLGGR